MRLLLDTNAFVRWMAGTALPRPVERELSRSQTQIFVSIVTAWEIVMKRALNRSATEVEEATKELGATLLPIKFAHLDELSRLPLFDNHRDPFDRMLIAQALAENVPIVSSDMRFESYKSLRILWD